MQQLATSVLRPLRRSSLRSHPQVGALRDIPLFDHLDDAALARLARHVDRVTVGAGTVLVRQGARPSRDLLLILDGAVRIERDGGELARLGSGDFLGELSLLDGMPTTATAIVETRTDLLILHRDGFMQLLDTDPLFLRKLTIALGRRLRATNEAVAGLGRAQRSLSRGDSGSPP